MDANDAKIASSTEEKWLKIVRRETPARSARLSTLNPSIPCSAVSCAAAPTIARRLRHLVASRLSVGGVRHDSFTQWTLAGTLH
ncbi:hypothetical protein M3D63_12235 [Kocuria palustris]|uniref:hypothetical protein n=1 Tax=Kocuria palustris TaxID=71999 RepID=UPI00045EAA81|nr:hypothetical protein [Kocuria palustris]MCT1835524.1 hypothetical protein [Kocuria palustris]